MNSIKKGHLPGEINKESDSNGADSITIRSAIYV